MSVIGSTVIHAFAANVLKMTRMYSATLFTARKLPWVSTVTQYDASKITSRNFVKLFILSGVFSLSDLEVSQSVCTIVY